MAASVFVGSSSLSLQQRCRLTNASPPTVSSCRIPRGWPTICCAASPPSSSSSPLHDPYTTLGVAATASEEEIKKARRRLALKFHPDVCKSGSCTAQFIQVERAYETIMYCLNGKKVALTADESDVRDGMMGVYDDSWEDWEEWMGWEGAGTRDYSSHINYSL